MRIRITSLIFYIVKNFVPIILVLFAAIFMQPSSLTALILAQCAHILTRFIEHIYYWYREDYTNLLPGVPSEDDYFCLTHKEKMKRIKSFIVFLVYKIVAILILWILSKTDKDLFGTIANIVAFVVIMRMAMPRTHKKMNANQKNVLIITRDDALYAIFTRIVSKKEKTLYKVLTFLSRVMLIIGFVMTIIYTMPGDSDAESLLSFRSVAIVGCVFWALRMALAIYVLCVDYELCDLSGEDDYDNGNEYGGSYSASNSSAGNDERAISLSEVKGIVQKIASKWSYKEDRSAFLNEASIRFNVSVEVLYDEVIEYFITGTIRCKDGDVSSAFTMLGDKVEKAAGKIQLETQAELEKYKLGRDYEIRVKIGEVTRG